MLASGKHIGLDTRTWSVDHAAGGVLVRLMLREAICNGGNVAGSCGLTLLENAVMLLVDALCNGGVTSAVAITDAGREIEIGLPSDETSSRNLAVGTRVTCHETHSME